MDSSYIRVSLVVTMVDGRPLVLVITIRSVMAVCIAVVVLLVFYASGSCVDVEARVQRYAHFERIT